jgi:hypothetical protein
MKSDVPELKKGTVLKDDAVLDIPEKKSVKVLLLPSNVTMSIAGPYKGLAKDYAPSALPSLAKPAKSLDTGTFLGTRASEDAPKGKAKK